MIKHIHINLIQNGNLTSIYKYNSKKMTKFKICIATEKVSFIMTFFQYDWNKHSATLNQLDYHQIATSVVSECDADEYTNKKGEKVRLNINPSVNNTCFISHKSKIKIQKSRPTEEGKIEMVFCTTIGAARRLFIEGYENIAALNFACPTIPGGLFLGGAVAQEESCCRCSGLYKTLLSQPEFYKNNENEPQSGLFTDGMIVSPKVPVYRDDVCEYLDEPFYIDFITSPAPEAYTYRRNEKRNPEKKLKNVLDKRIQKILIECINRDYDAIILGAYGCGVFANDPTVIADIFKEYLIKKKYKNYFSKVIFAIFSPNNPSLMETFSNILGSKPINNIFDETDDYKVIKKIQFNLRKLIKSRVQEIGCGKIDNKLPILRKEDINGETKYITVSGIFFNYTLKKDSLGNIIVSVGSLNRFIGGSGQLHDITADEIILKKDHTDY